MTLKNKLTIGVLCLLATAAFFGVRAYQYQKQPDYKTFKSNITFQYPKSWTVKTRCDFKGAFIGTRTIVRGDFKASKDAKLVMYGSISDKKSCENGKIALDITDKCRNSDKRFKGNAHIALSKLNNTGLTGAPVDPTRVTSIHVLSDCGESLFNFDFVKNNGEQITLSDDLLRYQEPGVNKGQLLKSDAYKEIVEFAESIKTTK